MYNINYILAIDKNYAIGNKNELLYFFKKDLKRFKELTSNKTVVMGKNTWNSLPFKLPNRINIVLSSSDKFENKTPDKIIHNIQDILDLSLNEEIWILGGASLYKELIDYVNIIELTLIHNDNVEYDVDVKFLEFYLPKFEVINSDSFIEEDKNSSKNIEIEFITYKRLE